MRRNILITGASSGLGAEMARQFAAKGHDLALTARRTERLEALRAELAGSYPQAKVVIHTLDVNDHEQVFEVFRAIDAELPLDRVVVNAGLGKGAPLGTGRFDANRDTALTNFVGSLAQAEAAMELFRARNAGHLVLISSISGLRGLPKTVTTYAATKAGLAALGEGLRMELLGKPIKVSTIYPGYIRSEMNEKVANTPLIVGTEPGVRAIVAAIEAEKAKAYVPRWPWAPIARVMRFAPLPVLRRMI
ncbi:SDR family oxidoreductase [Kribbella solani]|uniref:Short-subunit dehydrogenase n=1 Tax=Kribbella solani TaxID=236067 RepID=A0A841E0P5_9ACTN|nr:SDR family oxidoreductase [Kribbella solani]MBB5981987.1 short-subunit dehydrogenase [Kribbella solani]MDX2969012.1 SDR family oxidoreductase [Kribbella solani]